MIGKLELSKKMIKYLAHYFTYMNQFECKPFKLLQSFDILLVLTDESILI